MCLYKALGNINVVDISNFVSYFFYFSVYLFTSRASQNIIIMWDKYTYTCMYVVYISIERTCTHMSVQLGSVIPDFIWFFYYCVSYTTHAIQNTHMLFFIFHSMGGGVNLLFFYAYPRWHPLWSKEEEEAKKAATHNSPHGVNFKTQSFCLFFFEKTKWNISTHFTHLKMWHMHRLLSLSLFYHILSVCEYRFCLIFYTFTSLISKEQLFLRLNVSLCNVRMKNRRSIGVDFHNISISLSLSLSPIIFVKHQSCDRRRKKDAERTHESSNAYHF